MDFQFGMQFSPNKLFFHESSLRRALQKVATFPIMYELSLSGWCNENCHYCFNMHNHTKQILSRYQIKNILDQIKYLNGKAIELTGGGEPLLSPHASFTISYAKSLGLSVGIITNGSNISSTMAEIISANASYCRISIDSISPLTYKKIRGCDNSSIALTGLKRLIEAKKGNSNNTLLIGAHIVWSDQSINDIRSTVEYFSNSGIDFLQIRPVDNVPGVKDSLRPNYTFKQIYELWKLVDKYNKGQFRLTTSADKWNDVLSSTLTKDYTGCVGGNFTAAIGHDNKLYFCCSRIGTEYYCIGDLTISSLENLLISSKRNELINCVDHAYCLLQCRNHNMNKTINNLNKLPIFAREELINSYQILPHPLHYEFL